MMGDLMMDDRKTPRARRAWGWAAIWVAVLLAVVLIAALAVGRQSETPAARTTVGYGRLNVETISVITSGAEGSAAGSGMTDGAIRGRVQAIHIDYGSTVTSTTDITISLSNPALTLMTKANNATDTWYYPVVQGTGSDGTGVSGVYDAVPVNGRLTLTVAQSSYITSTPMVTATIWWGD